MTLYVKNLQQDVTEDDIKGVFSGAVEVRIPRRPDGSSKGFAYVDFENEDQVKEFVESEDEIKLGGEVLVLDYDRKDEDTTMFVKNLKFSVNEDTLLEVFQKATGVRIPKTPEGEPRGFAYVEFDSAKDVKDAVENQQGVEVEGRALYLDYNSPNQRGSRNQGGRGGGRGPRGRSGGDAPTRTLVCLNLSYDTTEDTLWSYFENAESMTIVTDRDTKRPKGLAMIDFSSPEVAKEMMETKTGIEIDGREIRLEFKRPMRSGRGGYGGRGRGRGGGYYRGGGYGGGYGGYNEGYQREGRRW